jgi:hypothetical protein
LALEVTWQGVDMNGSPGPDGYSLEEVAQAIEFTLRNYDKSTQTLPAEANELCNVYGVMLYKRSVAIAVTELSVTQLQLVREALSGQQRIWEDADVAVEHSKPPGDVGGDSGRGVQGGVM